MNKNTTIQLIVASIEDAPLFVKLIKKYHQYDAIEMMDKERLIALRPLLLSKEKGNIWIVILGDKSIWLYRNL